MGIRNASLSFRAALLGGVVLLAVHSLLAIAMFVRVYSHRGIAQTELDWLVFDVLDYPTSYIAFPWLGSTAPMRALFDWGYDLVGSGPNLRDLLLSLCWRLSWFLVAAALRLSVAAANHAIASISTPTPKAGFRLRFAVAGLRRDRRCFALPPQSKNP